MTRQLLYGLLTIVLLLLTFDGLFVSCKKYEQDNEAYQFKRPIQRLSAPSGGWHLYSYLVNGADSTDALRSKNPTSYNPYGVLPYFNIDARHQTFIDFTSQIGKGGMKLIDRKNKLNIHIWMISGMYNPFINSNTEWEIKELTTKVLKISATINGINYGISFHD